MGLLCQEAEPMIGYLLDNELDTAQSQQVQAHLETCVSCRQVLQNESSLRQVLRRAATSIDTPPALRSRLFLTMQRERRRQVGLARAWPFAMAAIILISFVWRNPNVQAPLGLGPLIQAHSRQVAADVMSADPQVVAHYLRGQLSFDVPLDLLAASVGALQPQQYAARVVEQDGHQSTYLRIDFSHGSMSLMINPSGAVAPGAAHTSGQASLGPALLGAAVRREARLLYMAQDVHGLTVAQWQTHGLVYDMVSDLPKASVAACVRRMAP